MAPLESRLSIFLNFLAISADIYIPSIFNPFIPFMLPILKWLTMWCKKKRQGLIQNLKLYSFLLNMKYSGSFYPKLCIFRKSLR